MMLSFAKVMQKAMQSSELNKEEIILLLSAPQEAVSTLLSFGDELRRRYMGEKIELRGIIEISSYCKQDCLYCGLRRGNTRLKRYRLGAKEILAAAYKAISVGYRTIVLQGGEDEKISSGEISRIIEAIRKMGAVVTLSLGEKDQQIYKEWREAGAERYLLKQETANSEIYSYVRPGKSLKKRLEHQQRLKDLGYQLGAGCIVGLPGQDISSLAEDLLLHKAMGAGMVAMGPFIPNPYTPLSGCPMGSVGMTLKMGAVARILMPHLHIPATTAMDSAEEGGRIRSLQAGANVMMLNVTSSKAHALYEIYPKKEAVFDAKALQPEKIAGLLGELGRTLSLDEGHCLSSVVR